MKIYCKLCDKVQPVIIDNCRDAKTNEPFQDIVCKECHLVIAAGTDIQREWVEVECPLCGEMAVAHTHPNLNKEKNQ